MSGLLLGHIIDPDIDDKWEDIAAEIETLEVGLEIQRSALGPKA